MPKTNRNTISDSDSDNVWSTLCTKLQNTRFDNKIVPASSHFTDASGSGDQIVASNLAYDDLSSFTLRFYRYDNEPNIIEIQSIGQCGETTKKVGMDMLLSKESKVLEFAVAGRGRMWLTGQSTIHGDVFSTWDRAAISPFNMTSDSAVMGTINTVLTLDQIKEQSYQMETLNEADEPIDQYGHPIGNDYEDRYCSEDDEIQAYHEGINYGQPDSDMPGISIGDYNTDMYANATTAIPVNIK